MNTTLPGLFACLLMVLGCGPSQKAQDEVSAHPAVGVIRDFPADGKSIVIRHEEIPGVMPRMTMTLNVRNPDSLIGLREGDEVRFRLHIGRQEHWIDSIERIGHQPSPPFTTVANEQPVKELGNGHAIPDFEWLDEDGRIRSMKDFRGVSVALTFIFTRCPLPEYCPRMTRHFSETQELLLKRPEKPTHWQFLSLSFDPDFDTPEVLKRYAETARGGRSTRWMFGALGSNTISRLAAGLDLGIVPDGAGFSHNLRTVVIDARGRIHRQFDGNGWTPAELAEAVVEAARVP